ncbi:DUF1634 domain-containing protein [Patescibacteria group bacterium]|nr:DUF1634 domain-containing protein [Patescibacteria group bacterium]
MKHSESLQNMEIVVSAVLQAGVIVSSVIILIGITLFFIHAHQAPALQHSYRRYTAANYSFPHTLAALKNSDTLAALKNSAMTGQGVGLIELGVLLLILTPVLRVATSILLFRRQRDWPMTLVTLFVLVVLIGSFILGITVR